MVELSTPVRFWFLEETGLQSKGCRFNSCPFHSFLHVFSSLLFLTFNSSNGSHPRLAVLGINYIQG